MAQPDPQLLLIRSLEETRVALEGDAGTKYQNILSFGTKISDVRSAANLELGRDAGTVVLEGDAGWLVQSANADATAGTKAQILTLLALAGKGACASASRGAGRTRGIPAHVRPRGHRQGISSSLKAAGSPDVS